MIDMVHRITKIQNTAKSLKWGIYQHSPTEYLFAVGHTAYPGVVNYLLVSEDLGVSVVEGDTVVLVKMCESVGEVMSEVKKLLTKWFPAK